MDEGRDLLARDGPSEKLHNASAAIDPQSGQDDDVRDDWRPLKTGLPGSASKPFPSDLDIYRTANLLIASKDGREAAACALQRGVEIEGDAVGQAVWARVFEAILVLVRTEPGRDDNTH